MGTYDIRIRGNGPYSGFGNKYDANRVAQDLVKVLQENGHDVTEARFVADGGGEDNLLTADYTRFQGPAPTADEKKKLTPLEEATKLSDEQREDEERLRKAGPIPRTPVPAVAGTGGQGQPSAAGQTAGTVQPVTGGGPTQPGPVRATAAPGGPPAPAARNVTETKGPAIQGRSTPPPPTAPSGVVRESNATSDQSPANKAP